VLKKRHLRVAFSIGATRYDGGALRAAWSAAHADDMPEQALQAVYARFAEPCPGTAPDAMGAHLWPHALVEHLAGIPAIGMGDGAAHLGACGDWWEGPRVEAAFLSGVALAAKIAAAL